MINTLNKEGEPTFCNNTKHFLKHDTCQHKQNKEFQL